MSVEDFTSRYPEVAETIYDRGFRAQHLINQFGDRPKFRCLYGEVKHGHMIGKEKKFL